MNPHLSQPILVKGPPLGKSEAAAILIHGRNGSPKDMLGLAEHLKLPRFTYLAPAAANHTWYPARFMEKLEANEPYLSYALERIDRLVADIVDKGYAKEQIVLLGFSQGACLTAEYAVRHATRYGGVILFTGGLIGPPGTRWEYGGSFAATPVFLGSSDVDSWVPLPRVQESSAVFKALGAEVTERIYPGMGHLVNEDEIAHARAIMGAVIHDKAETGGKP